MRGHGLSLRVYRALLRLYPADFRRRFGEETVQLFSDQLRDASARGPLGGIAITWLRTLGDLAITAVSEHVRRDRTVAQSLAVPPSPWSRALGAAGITGGGLLVAAFIPGLPWTADLFNLRLALLNVGAVAIVAAVYRRQSAVAARTALVAAVPVLVANAWHLVLIVRIVAQPGEPGRGDYGPIYPIALGATWLAGAWFGLVSFRIEFVQRWAALALAIGSVLAFTPMIGMADGAYGTLFGQLALAGIALTGLGWIFLGIDVATRRRPAPAPSTSGAGT